VAVKVRAERWGACCGFTHQRVALRRCARRDLSRHGDVLVAVDGRSTLLRKSFPKILLYLNQCVRTTAIVPSSLIPCPRCRHGPGCVLAPRCRISLSLLSSIACGAPV
jgi:hypothetical protein